MYLKSSHFKHNDSLPERFTCEGENISPALEWGDAPEKTKSFVIIVEDPDAPDPQAPQRVFVHWVIYNIPDTTCMLNDGEHIPEKQLGRNDFKKTTYGGPCPPIGQHRYFFTLYALDAMLTLSIGASKDKVLESMDGHVLASAVLIGLYQKKKQ